MMKINFTTVCGAVAAASMAVLAIDDLPPSVVLWLRVVGAIAVALLGYHAQNEGPPGGKPMMLLLCCLLAAFCLLIAGCRVGGLAFDVKSPTFGSVGVTLDGGMIGHGKLPLVAPIPCSATNH